MFFPYIYSVLLSVLLNVSLQGMIQDEQNNTSHILDLDYFCPLLALF